MVITIIVQIRNKENIKSLIIKFILDKSLEGFAPVACANHHHHKARKLCDAKTIGVTILTRTTKCYKANTRLAFRII